ncbi:MAG: hypothetical protein Q9M40_03165 [Sulfurimonas sp.]|nr:hypothetical protein [Sulfurimonas sp.]
MMEFLGSIIWYLSWPIVIGIAVNFVHLNIKHYKRMERLEELEARYAADMKSQNPQ